MKKTYEKPIIVVVEMRSEENLANSYWAGSWQKNTETYWGSPNCEHSC